MLCVGKSTGASEPRAFLAQALQSFRDKVSNALGASTQDSEEHEPAGGLVSLRFQVLASSFVTRYFGVPKGPRLQKKHLRDLTIRGPGSSGNEPSEPPGTPQNTTRNQRILHRSQALPMYVKDLKLVPTTCFWLITRCFQAGKTHFSPESCKHLQTIGVLTSP